MADQNNSESAANFNFPAEPEGKPRAQFSVHLWNDRFFFVSYSNDTDHSHSAYSHPRRDQKTVPLVN